jgi:hypothetical protein
MRRDGVGQVSARVAGEWQIGIGIGIKIFRVFKIINQWIAPRPCDRWLTRRSPGCRATPRKV